MIELKIMVGVIVVRHEPANPWAAPYWMPDQVLPSPAAAEPWTRIGGTDSRQSFYAGAAEVSLYSTDTANYLSNLGSGAPKLWVVLRASTSAAPVEVVRVTADPAEGEAFTEAGSDTVEPVAMPPDVAAAIAAFCEGHHIERVFEKRKRNRAVPDFSRGGS